jgi:hypothetical protein
MYQVYIPRFALRDKVTIYFNIEYVVEGVRHRLNDWFCIVVYCIVIHIFLLLSMETNRAIYSCTCALSIVIFRKVLMGSEIGLKCIASFVVW